MDDPYSQDSFSLEEIIGFLAKIVGVAAALAWCYFWLAVYPNHITDDARKIWHTKTGTITKVSEVKGDSPQTAFRMAVLSFPNFSGHNQTKEVPMSYTVEPGDKKPVVVGKKGGVWIDSDLNNKGLNPRNPANDIGVILSFVVVPILIGAIVGSVSWMVMMFLAMAVIKFYRMFTRPALFKVAGIKIKRFTRSLMDEVKLRWEFTRRRRRIRLSPAYKQVRRFQAELARMDPTPSVIAARRRANELLTKVLDRDNERLEVINGLIDVIRQDTELDLEARRQAHEELAENY